MRDFTIFFFNFIHIKKHNNNNLIVKTKRLEHLAIIIIQSKKKPIENPDIIKQMELNQTKLNETNNGETI